MSADSSIIVAAEGPILRITINRPQVRNALDPAAHADMAAAFDRFAADGDLRVAIVTGAGDKAFCAGSDLKVRAAMGGDDMPTTGFAGIAERFDLDKPVIAAVNGDALGGGLEMVLASDLAIAVEGARFGLPEPKIGLAAAGGLHRIAREIPTKWANEIVLTGRLFDATTAAKMSLINDVVEKDSFHRAVDDLAAEIAANAPLAVRASKAMMHGGRRFAALADAFAGEYPVHERMLASEDAVEGSRAFVEKRKPNWKNR